MMREYRERQRRKANGRIRNAAVETIDAERTTRAGYFRDVRRVFAWGVETGLVDANPFEGLRRGSFQNKTREQFLSREVYARLLDACPTMEDRALIALYRIGGLRKGEALEVKWEGVDFCNQRVLVPSPKTATFGKPSRTIPLFPELRDELEPLWDSLEERSSPYVIARHRNPNKVFSRVKKIVFGRVSRRGRG